VIIRRSYPKARIATKLNASGGISISAALERAEAALETVRAECISAVDEKVRRIAALARALDEGDEMYDLANEVFAEAGAFGLDEVGEAARSLCDLLGSNGAHKHAAIKVHADALCALRHRDIHDDPERRQSVLFGLREVVKRYAPDVTALGQSQRT